MSRPNSERRTPHTSSFALLSKVLLERLYHLRHLLDETVLRLPCLTILSSVALPLYTDIPTTLLGCFRFPRCVSFSWRGGVLCTRAPAAGRPVYRFFFAVTVSSRITSLHWRWGGISASFLSFWLFMMTSVTAFYSLITSVI